MVIEASQQSVSRRALRGSDAVDFAHHICAAQNGSSLSDVLGAARGSLKGALADALAMEPTLAVLARRTLLACVVLHWISHKGEALDDTAEEHLAETTRGFYSLHVNSVARRGLMEYLHISKSGGTTFSATAKHSNCRMAPGIGQLESLGDLPRWINGTAFEEVTGGTDIMWSYYSTEGRQRDGVRCHDRVAHLKLRHGYNYVSNEFTMHGAEGPGNRANVHVCPQVVNVVTLRDPDSRLISHLHFMLARIKTRLSRRTVRGGGDAEGAESADDNGGGGGGGDGNGGGGGGGGRRSGVDLFWGLFCPGNLSTWQLVAPTVVDNYMTRSFVGERAFHAPVGAIGHEQVDLARRVLLGFDLVLDLDAGEEANDRVLWQGLGWDVEMSEIHARTSTSVYAKLNYTTEECHDEELRRALLARQGPDRHLYSFGRVLALLDRLHLAMARKLGLQPTVEGGRAGGGDSCGLLSAADDTAAAANDDNDDGSDDDESRRGRLLRRRRGRGLRRLG